MARYTYGTDGMTAVRELMLMAALRERSLQCRNGHKAWHHWAKLWLDAGLEDTTVVKSHDVSPQQEWAVS